MFLLLPSTYLYPLPHSFSALCLCISPSSAYQPHILSTAQDSLSVSPLAWPVHTLAQTLWADLLHTELISTSPEGFFTFSNKKTLKTNRRTRTCRRAVCCDWVRSSEVPTSCAGSHWSTERLEVCYDYGDSDSAVVLLQLPQNVSRREHNSFRYF